VASFSSSEALFLAANVKHHGASPWHLEENLVVVFCSSERETPRGKPVASFSSSEALFLAANVKYHGASPWHLQFK
jgi:hypothetical protein